MDYQIVILARRLAERYGRRPTSWEERELLRYTHQFMDEGRPMNVAVEYAAVVVMNLHAVEDPPWR